MRMGGGGRRGEELAGKSLKMQGGQGPLLRGPACHAKEPGLPSRQWFYPELMPGKPQGSGLSQGVSSAR